MRATTLQRVESSFANLRGFGYTDVFLRLLCVPFDSTAAPVSAAFTSDAVEIPAGCGWQNVALTIAPAALTAIHDSGLYAGLRIGVDNITAAATIPEPGTRGLLLVPRARHRLR